MTVHKKICEISEQTHRLVIYIARCALWKKSAKLHRAIADRRGNLLNRLDGFILHHDDCVYWKGDENYCDCSFPYLLEDIQKELFERSTHED